jgi:Amt family ammonium transporter
LIDYRRTKQATAVGAATGAVVGLVAITPAAGYVTPGAALLIGALASCASQLAIHLRNRTGIDDALDVFACHGVAGIVGAVLTGVFASKAVNPAGADGLLFGGVRLFGVQMLAVLCTMAFTAPVTALALARLRAVGSLRLALPNEMSGVDVSEHGEHAYDDGEMSALTGSGLGISEPVFIPATGPKVLKTSEAA